jgi:hypothetical protein
MPPDIAGKMDERCHLQTKFYRLIESLRDALG